MPKSRPNRKQLRNADRRAKELHGYSAATQVRVMAGALPNQDALDTVLLQEKDLVRRGKLFSFMEPFLKFPDPQMPSESGIIAPGSKSLIVRP